MLVLGVQFVELGQHPVQGHRLLAGREQEDRLDREGDRGDDAEGAETDPGRGEDRALLGGPLRRAGEHRTVGGDQLQPSDLRGEEAESRPVPWVPVLVAPETVCSMMSPMLVSDSPSRARAALSRLIGVPAPTVTVPASRSMSRIPASR